MHLLGLPPSRTVRNNFPTSCSTYGTLLERFKLTEVQQCKISHDQLLAAFFSIQDTFDNERAIEGWERRKLRVKAGAAKNPGGACEKPQAVRSAESIPAHCLGLPTSGLPLSRPLAHQKTHDLALCRRQLNIFTLKQNFSSLYPMKENTVSSWASQRSFPPTFQIFLCKSIKSMCVPWYPWICQNREICDRI